jgi:hypothetical protein
MKKKISLMVLALVTGITTGCGRTDFSSDVVVVESDEPIELAGNRYLSNIEKYYYTFGEDGTLHLEAVNGKYEFDGTYEVEGDKVTLSAENTDGEESVITYEMKHGEEEGSVVLETEEGEKFLLTVEEEE